MKCWARVGFGLVTHRNDVATLKTYVGVSQQLAHKKTLRIKLPSDCPQSKMHELLAAKVVATFQAVVQGAS